ncbi:MAG TPA: hypothetical protein VKM54_13415 [Myxococcota bacterium]|nr:hypothetical protein [Myxococcota bacterium]
MISATLVSRIAVDDLPSDGPVPSLTRRIIELLCVEKEDLVVDLYCRDLQSPQGLVFLVLTSGVRMVQMGTLTFGRFPMCYEKVLLRDGFSLLRGSFRHLLAAVFSQLDPAARFLILVDNAPSSDAPLFAEGLRRWKRQQRSHEVIAELMREAGFSVQAEIGEFLRSGVRCGGRVSGHSRPRLLPRSGAGARSVRAPRPLRLRADG